MEKKYKETIFINKFINLIMKKGKKQLALNIFKNVFFEIKKIKKNSFFIFKKAILNLYPVVYFKLKKKGSRIFKLPTKITDEKASFLCITWILQGAKNRKSSKIYNTFSKKLIAEIIDTSKGFSYSIKKKTELYNLIIENRPFLRYKSSFLISNI